MIFRTISGSSYEIDQENKKVRRLYGKLPSTDRQGQDGEWKSYKDLSDLTIGKPVVIVWDYATEDSGDILAKSTVTSLLLEIVNQEQLS